MKRKIMISFLVAMFLGPLAVNGLAQSDEAEEETKKEKTKVERSKMSLRDYVKRLNLTREQIEKVKAQREAGKLVNKDINSRLHTKWGELKTELNKETPDKDTIKQLKKDIHAIKKEQLEQKVRAMKEFRGILTKEQKQKMKEIRQKQRAKMKKKKGEQRKKLKEKKKRKKPPKP